MPSSKIPGSICTTRFHVPIDDGTLCRSASPTPRMINGGIPKKTISHWQAGSSNPADARGWLNLFGADDQFFTDVATKAARPIGKFWITGHGYTDIEAVKIDGKPGSVDKLVERMEKAGYKLGSNEPVWMDVCNAGSRWFALRLSQALGGVDVYASPTRVWYGGGRIWTQGVKVEYPVDFNNLRQYYGFTHKEVPNPEVNSVRYIKFNSSEMDFDTH